MRKINQNELVTRDNDALLLYEVVSGLYEKISNRKSELYFLKSFFLNFGFGQQPVKT